MPRKIKTIPLETILVKDDEDTHDDDKHDDEAQVDSYEAVINLIQDESQTDNEDVTPPPPPPVEKVKKVRAPRKGTGRSSYSSI